MPTMDVDTMHEKAAAQVEATADQGERAASELLAALQRIAEQFVQRTAPQLPSFLQQPARDHALATLTAAVALTLLLAIGASRRT